MLNVLFIVASGKKTGAKWNQEMMKNSRRFFFFCSDFPVGGRGGSFKETKKEELALLVQKANDDEELIVFHCWTWRSLALVFRDSSLLTLGLGLGIERVFVCCWRREGFRRNEFTRTKWRIDVTQTRSQRIFFFFFLQCLLWSNKKETWNNPRPGTEQLVLPVMPCVCCSWLQLQKRVNSCQLCVYASTTCLWIRFENPWLSYHFH